MLRHSTNILMRRKLVFQICRISNEIKSGEFETTTKPMEKVKVDENIKNKVKNLSSTAMTKYNELIGFMDIDEAYKKVTMLQESLHTIQSERTVVQLQISNVRSDLSNIQSEIHEHKRGEPKYLELMKKEFEEIRLKNKLEEHYQILDKKEREQFSHLQAKINILHERSKTHTRKWGIISTITGALLGIIGTSISAYYRNNDIRNIQKGIQMQFQVQIDQITKDTQQIMKGYENLLEYLQRSELTLKKNEKEKTEQLKNTESWTGFFKRKTVSIWRWCMFQKSSS